MLKFHSGYQVSCQAMPHYFHNDGQMSDGKRFETVQSGSSMKINVCLRSVKIREVSLVIIDMYGVLQPGGDCAARSVTTL